jgi:hypothetical protein
MVEISRNSVTASYVSESIVPAKAGRKCVDGRYLPHQAAGMIARPGGDGGYVMALMAVNRKKKLGLSPEQCFNAVYKVVQNDHGFCMHTDQYTDPDDHTHNGLIGCGHLAKAASQNFCEAYDVNGDDVEKIIHYARNLKEISSALHIVNLKGEHQEQGVLIVNSNDFTVLADNPTLHQMYFIYDEQRDIAFIKKLVKEMAIAGVTYEDMKEESDLQLHATLQILAANLPIYQVSFIDNKPTVTFAGVVEPKTLTTRKKIFRRINLPKLPHFAQKLINN